MQAPRRTNFSTLRFLLSFVLAFSLIFVVRGAVSYKTYSIDDGLISSYVYQIYQDSRGYVWFATDRGVSRYNGRQFKNFTIQDGLPANDIWYLREDNHDRLWFYSHREKNVFLDLETLNFVEFQIPRKTYFLPQGIFEGVDGDYWVPEYRSGLLKIGLNGQVERLFADELNNGRPFSSVVFIGQDQGANLFFNGKAVVRRSEGRQEKFPIPALASGKGEAVFLTRGREGSCYFSHRDSIYVFSPDNRSFQGKACAELGKGMEFKRVFARTCGEEEYFFFQFDGGTVVTDLSFRAVSGFKFLEDVQILDLVEDWEGNVWVVTSKHEVRFYSKAARKGSSFPGAFEKQVAVKSVNKVDSLVYFGNESGEIFVENDGNIERIFSWEEMVEGDAPPAVFSSFEKAVAQNQSFVIEDLQIDKKLFAFSAGKFFFWGQARELERIEDKKFSFFGSEFSERNQFEELLSGERDTVFPGSNTSVIYTETKDLLIESESSILISTGHMVFRFGGLNTSRPWLVPLYKGRIGRLGIDEEGKVWLGELGGLWFLESGNLVPFAEGDPRLESGVVELFSTEDGRLWIGTAGYGLLVLENGQNAAISVQGLENEYIRDLTLTGDGEILGVTSKGIFSFSGYQENIEEGVLRGMGLAEGLPTNEIYSIANLGDKIYLGSKAGLLRFPQNIFSADRKSISVMITSFSTNAGKKDWRNLSDLDYAENQIAIEWDAICFSCGEELMFRYHLEGPDSLEGLTSSKEFKVSNLAAGSYSFSVQEVSQGQDGTPLTRLEFAINKPLWQKPLFLAFLGILALLAILGINFRVVRLVRKKEEAKRDQIVHFAELELKGLQTQMNPHFLFNALNAIQGYILEEDVVKANSYLAGFSRLMRLFLENSRAKFVPLAEELELLKQYIRMEQLRFPGKFEFELSLPQAIPVSEIEIPTQILQPFIENAINHGIRHLEKDGLLKISVLEEAEEMVVEVEDNGVGRSFAQKLNSTRKQRHKSRAGAIVKERIATFNRAYGVNLRLEIRDLKFEGKANGTLVRISWKKEY